MEKGIKSRSKILEVAFKLFATYSYPDVSYSLLEEATGISRGSMVYYFKNKEGIFRAVLDNFLFDWGHSNDIPLSARNSLRDFCTQLLENLESSIGRMQAYHIPNLCEARFNIERSALQFIPEFKANMLESQNKVFAIWEEVIRNSVASGELKPDIDPKAIARLFHEGAMGFAYTGVFGQSTRSLTEFAATLATLYSLIENKRG